MGRSTYPLLCMRLHGGHQRGIYFRHRNTDGTWGPWIEIGPRANATTGSSAQANRGAMDSTASMMTVQSQVITANKGGLLGDHEVDLWCMGNQ